MAMKRLSLMRGIVFMTSIFKAKVQIVMDYDINYIMADNIVEAQNLAKKMADNNNLQTIKTSVKQITFIREADDRDYD
jgi:hypothetical protein